MRGETFITAESRYLILYDGSCGLCNRAVQWLLLRDKQDRFRFCALESASGKAIVSKAPLHIRQSDSIILQANNQFYHQSTAVLKAGIALGGRYRAFAIFLLVPRFLRDWVYRFVARNRKRWWPFDPACMLLRPEWTHKFLD